MSGFIWRVRVDRLTIPVHRNKLRNQFFERNNMASATLTSKGQITLPKAVLDRLHLGPGDQVYFVLGADGRFDLIPVKANINSLKNCVHAP